MLRDYLESGRIMLTLGSLFLIALGVSYLDQPLSALELALCLISGFFITLGVYSFNTITDEQEDSVNKPQSAVISGRRSRAELLVFSLFSKGIALISAYFLSWASFALVSIVVLISFLYSYRFFGSIRIKDMFVLKSITVAGLWSVAPLLPILSVPGPIPPGFHFVVLFAFLHSLISTLIADLRDIEGDSMHGIKTLPVALGAQKTLYMLNSLNLLSFIALVGGMAFWEVKGYLILLILVCFWRQYGFWLIQFGVKPVGEVYSSLDNPTDIMIGTLAIAGKLAGL